MNGVSSASSSFISVLLDIKESTNHFEPQQLEAAIRCAGGGCRIPEQFGYLQLLGFKLLCIEEIKEEHTPPTCSMTSFYFHASEWCFLCIFIFHLCFPRYKRIYKPFRATATGGSHSLWRWWLSHSRTIWLCLQLLGFKLFYIQENGEEEEEEHTPPTCSMTSFYFYTALKPYFLRATC